MNKDIEIYIYLSPAVIGYILSTNKKDRKDEYNEIISNVKYYGKNVKRNDIYRFWTKKYPVEVWYDGINYCEDNVYDVYFLNEKYNTMFGDDGYFEFNNYIRHPRNREFVKFCLEAYETYKQDNSIPEL